MFKPSSQPVLSPRPNTYYADGVTGMDMLAYNGRFIGYFCALRGGVETIGMCEWAAAPAGEAPENVSGAPVLASETGQLCDPACVVVNGAVYMFFSFLGKDADSIGVAVSNNGKDFTMLDERVLVGRAPEVVYKDGRFHLFYVKDNARQGYDIYTAVSRDGLRFQEEPLPVISALEGWDAVTVTTPRIFEARGYFYCLYCGDGETKDYPKAAGVCRSKDLLAWEKAAGAVMECSGLVETDFMWVPTGYTLGDDVHVMYEAGKIHGETCVSSIRHAGAKLAWLDSCF